MKKCQSIPVFYQCPICGNFVEIIEASGMIPVCCGQEMQKVVAKFNDEALEKHVPVCTVKCGKVVVKVGSTPHPMLEEHHICWIELVTDKGIQRKCVYPKEEATACFHIGDNENVIAVYEFCSQHGLWSSVDTTKLEPS